jgi:hypothetical protein
MANVVATASSTGKVGVAVLAGKEHAVRIKNIVIVKRRLMQRLYSFSEQINSADVIRVKERK